MSAVVSAVSTSNHIATAASNSTRRTADFHPSIWGSHFLAYASDNMEVEVDNNMRQEFEMLKEDVRMMFPSTMEDNTLAHKLNFINSVQRLGVAYHFESEIDEALQQIYNSCTGNNIITHCDDLHSIALLFRLLRQQGYHISPGVFNKFKDETGKFSARLENDVPALLSLYEAAQYRVKGEELLDEALDFTQNQLVRSLKNQLSPSMEAQVKRSLNRPLHKGMPRLESRYYMSFYKEDPANNKVLLTFAKLDFNILQKLHQKELGTITK
ncbi:hypothetical protein L6164_008597 [Bauhinia variegata]|uniref:Uncharacterized protein n=1 Tax=Bauhinia variegata TaxID=167791 RepID=A0ACB9PH89_BAUVA|nr:hypothetical protein L6164_008597 [Bauhinia variegata]